MNLVPLEQLAEVWEAKAATFDQASGLVDSAQCIRLSMRAHELRQCAIELKAVIESIE